MTDRDPLEELAEEFSEQVRAGRSPSVEDFAEQYPEHAAGIRELFPVILEFEQAKSLGSVAEDADNIPFSPDKKQSIGRYQIKRLLGAGGFGKVYLGWDDELHREVAIKVPHAGRRSEADLFSVLVREAKIAAKIDHPGIVPVFDIGKTDDGRCFFVSRFVNGESLADRLRRKRVRYSAAIDIVRQIADALHCAHESGLVHRDVKPGNILVDDKGHAYITDFGIALIGSESVDGLHDAGTPRYMSPEQAQRQFAVIDSRSDIYSLGVVFYEILTGTTPNGAADSTRELLDQIATRDPLPPRRVDPRIPTSLERICLKAIARRRRDRYQSAREFAEALTASLSVSSRGDRSVPRGPTSSDFEPAGLAAYSESSAQFFRRLLPGPYDANGLPEAIRFWKQRIDPQAPEIAFRVGVLHGTSGTGKTSLVNAGILPNLRSDIRCVSVSSPHDGRLDRCLGAELHKQFPDLPANEPVANQLASLRSDLARRRGLAKLFVVIDQFERFLDKCSPASEEWQAVGRMLAQCDGFRIQCLLVVNSRVWLYLNELMRSLDLPLKTGVNAIYCDRFDYRHAKSVLRQLGIATKQISASNPTADVEGFLDQAVGQLLDDGRVPACVVAIFHLTAQRGMWTRKTRKYLTSPQIGAAVVEQVCAYADTLPAGVAPSNLRQVIRAFVPAGDEKVGNPRFRDLLAITGMPASDLRDAIGYLEHHAHMIQRVAPDATTERWDADEEPGNSDPDGVRFQLISPCVARWVTETTKKGPDRRRKAASFAMQQRFNQWQGNHLPWELPSLWEYLQFRYHVPSIDWSSGERRMMRAASDLFLVRGRLLGMLALAIMAAVAAVTWYIRTN